MGRKKVEMKLISDKSSRMVTFTKRRGGLIKKARELSVLCDVDLALLVFSARGKLFEFSSSSSATQIIQRYHGHNEAEELISKGGLGPESRFADFLTSSELLEIVERQLEEPYVDRLNANDLVRIETQIDAALFHIRSRKTELMLEAITTLHEKEKLLREENSRLVDELDAMAIDGNEIGEALAGNPNLANNRLNSTSPRLTRDLLV